jgi:hypothetical protein
MADKKKKISNRERCTKCMYKEFITGNSNRNPKKCNKKLKKNKKFRKFIRNTLKDADIEKEFPLHEDCPIKDLDLI